MERLQEISEFVDNLKIKKTFLGGYDREDVFVKMQELIVLFQKCLEEEQERQKQVINDYERQLQTSKMLVKELNKKLSSLLVAQKNLEQENLKMKDVYKEYCSNILQQYSDSLRTLSSEFSQILDNITNLQQNIINTEMFEGLEDKITASHVELIDQEVEKSQENVDTTE